MYDKLIHNGNVLDKVTVLMPNFCINEYTWKDKD